MTTCPECLVPVCQHGPCGPCLESIARETTSGDRGAEYRKLCRYLQGFDEVNLAIAAGLKAERRASSRRDIRDIAPLAFLLFCLAGMAFGAFGILWLATH